MLLQDSNSAEFCVPGEDNSSPDPEDIHKLSRLLEKYAPHDDLFNLTEEGIHVVRSSKTMDEKSYILSTSGICLVPQGAKSISFAGSRFEYDESRMAVYAAEVPINVKIIKASKDKPYLCLVIPIDPHRLSELILKVFPHGVPKAEQTSALYVGNINPKILKSAVRLMELIEQQEDIDLLVPLVIDEILIRLLRSPTGASIAQIGMMDSYTVKVSKAISWLKDNYTNPIKMDKLADIAGMSISSFHIHFKAITSMSPLQFQKALRLQEARNLLRIQMKDVSSTAFKVGYASASQFSREYTRYFGIAPSKDA